MKDIDLYGELHRFIPALASQYGARIAEVPIKNIPRPNGESHYGLGRTFRVFFDIVTIKFLLRYLTRPMHFFGKWGLVGIALADDCDAVHDCREDDRPRYFRRTWPAAGGRGDAFGSQD